MSVTTSAFDREFKPLEEHPVLAQVGMRELGRQAVLLAAREEFGGNTRDQSLAEPLDAPDAVLIESLVEPRHGLGLRIALTHNGETFYDQQVDLAIGPVFSCRQLAEKLEPLTTGQIADALASLGLKKQPNHEVESAALPEGAEQLLGTMDHVSQFRAVRSIHAAIRETGESPERLAGLARGYANLAMLNATVLDARRAAYRARAMLYAERLKRRAPNPQHARWTQAYVYTLIGFPSMALDYLDDEAGDADHPDAPEWLPVVLDGCHHRFEALGERAAQADDPLRQLAALLWMRSAWVSGSDVLAIETGGKCLSAAPGCLWVADGVNYFAGVAMKHRTSVLGPTLHGWLLAHTLPQVEDLPAPVSEQLPEADEPLSIFDTADAARLLIAAAADDAQEPSWAALGADIHAWATLHVYRRAQFLRHSLSVDASDFIDASEPVFAGNYWAPAVRTFRVAPTTRTEPYNRLLADFAVLDTNSYSSQDWVNYLPKATTLQNGSAGRLCAVAGTASDSTEMEYAGRIDASRGKGRVTTAKWMYDCSRHAPIRFATLIREDPSVTDQQVDEWNRDYGSHPVVALAIGQRLVDRDQLEQAIPYFHRYLDRAPDADVYVKLARAYFRQGDDRWQETLERILTHPDYSLNHAWAEGQIAATLLQQREFDAALPWAHAASESGAGWAWRIECECLAALGRRDEAVQLAEVSSQRYRSNEWYKWTALTGAGDLSDAWRYERVRLRQVYKQGRREIEFAHGLHLLIDGKRRECLDLLLTRANRNGNHWDAISIALLADELGDAELRDKWLGIEADRRDDKERHPYSELAGQFRAALVGGEFDESVLERIEAEAEGTYQWGPPLRLLSAWFLTNRGEQDRAIELHKECLRPKTPDDWVRILSSQALRAEGIDPFTIEGRAIGYALSAPPIEPPAEPES